MKLLSFADDGRYTIFTNRDISRLVIPLFLNSSCSFWREQPTP